MSERDEVAEAIAAGAGRPPPEPYPGWPTRRLPPEAARARRQRARRWAGGLTFGYVGLFALSIVAAVREGNGSGLEWMGTMVLALPWSLIPTWPTLFGGGVVNAALLHAFVRRVGSR